MVGLKFPPSVIIRVALGLASDIAAEDLRRGVRFAKEGQGLGAKVEQVRMAQAMAGLVGESGPQTALVGRSLVVVKVGGDDDFCDPARSESGKPEDTFREFFIAWGDSKPLFDKAVCEWVRAPMDIDRRHEVL